MSACNCIMSFVKSPFTSSHHHVPFFQSPFSTSPSQLQEVSLDLSGSSMQHRALSPGKMTPPIRGRTMKEYEEDMSNLKKENFRLKLRIFSLDDQMEKLVKDGGTVDILKRNVELQVELEALRKEYDDKHMLLVKAHQLVELTDKECKKALTEKDNEISALTSCVEELKKELEILRSSTSRLSIETSPRVFKFEAKQNSNVAEKRVSDLEDKTRRLSDSIRSQEIELERRNEELSELHNVLEDRTREISRLSAVLDERDAALEELTAKAKAYEHEIRWMREKSRSPCGSPRRHSCKAIAEQALEIEQKFKNLDGEHQKAIMAIQGLLKRSKDQARELEESRGDIERKERRIRELTSEMGRLCAKMDRCQTRGVELDDVMISSDDNDVVEELERQVKGIALALRERDEKLSDCEKNLMDRDKRITELAKEKTKGDNFWRRRAVELEARLYNTPERDGDSQIVTTLKADVLRARKDLEKAEMWQLETGDKCSLLMRRLEELALFLKSLLMDGRLLCGLSEKQRLLLKRIIDESMEMSRNLSLSLFGSTDVSLANGSFSFMGDTQQQSFLEFWSQDEEESNLIARLGAEVEKLKLEKYSPSTSKEQLLPSSSVTNTKDMIPSTTFNSLNPDQGNSRRERTCSPCESDAWSEPDRNVSLARIGLPVSDMQTPRSRGSSVSEDIALDITGKDENVQQQMKMQMLEKANDELKCQLVALHEWFTKLQPTCEGIRVNDADIYSDMKTSAHDATQGLVTVTSIELLEQVKLHRDKLESLLHQNEQTQQRLEKEFGQLGSGKDLIQKLEATQSLEEQLQVLKAQEVDLQNQVIYLNKHVEAKEQNVCELTAKVEQQQKDLKKSEEYRLKIEEQLHILESEICDYKEDKIRLEKCVTSLELKCSESQEFNDKLESNILLLDDSLREANELKSQLQNELLVLDGKYKRSEEEKLELQNQIELLHNKFTEIELEKCSLDEQIQDLQKKLFYAEQSSQYAMSQVTALQDENKKISEDFENRHRDLDKKLRDAEKLGSRFTSQMMEQVEKEKQIKEIEGRLLQREREVERKNEELTIQVSQLEMENARLENEKLHVERELHRVEMLTEKPKSPRRRLVSGGSQSSSLDYEWENPENTSASSIEVVNRNARSPKATCTSNLWVKLTENEAGTIATVGMNRAIISRGTNSPDLGIESDNGRFSSAETMVPDYKVACKSCVGLQKENVYLKHKQMKTESLLNDVYAQLSSANQMKREMRKSVFKELCKTKNVLKATRSNLETAMPRRLSD